METMSGLEAHLGYWLRLVSNRVSGEFARALQAHGTSVAEWVALSRIGGMEGPTAARLADAMGMTRGAVSKILDKLEARRLVTRTRSAGDSRVHLLALTAHGRRVLPQLAAVADRNDRHFFAVLGSRDEGALLGLLHKLVAAHGITGEPTE